jgi:NAD dependent epimerase/dehydratase
LFDATERISMTKKVLVTGAGGFIGSHLTEELVRQGHVVRALVRYNGRDDHGSLADLPAEIRSAVEVDRGDLKDPGAVRKATERCEWVFHLGALIAIPYSYQNPYDVVQTNVLGTAHVLDACRMSDALERVILTSTSEVYGTAQRVPIDECHPLQGQSPYAATKIAADALGASYHRSFGLPVAILRPFNTFGPRQSARAIIPTIISQALARPEVNLGRLDPRRDLTYVKDTVAGFIAIAGCDEALGRVVNIGRGEDLSIGELVELIGERMGRTITVRSEQARHRPAKSEVERLLAGTALAQSLWGWKPRYSLEAGLDETIEWVRSHIDRFRVDSYVT